MCGVCGVWCVVCVVCVVCVCVVCVWCVCGVCEVCVVCVVCVVCGVWCVCMCNPKETYPRKDPVVYLDKQDLARRYQLPKATVAAFLA